MAIIDQPLAIGAGDDAAETADRPLGDLTRPKISETWKDWLTTVDHKKIGIMYGVTAMFFFVIGGAEALLIRIQLATPNGKLLSPEVYNQVFTMHGVTMIFLVIMPLAAAFANYLLPLQIGARDVAFPRLNAVSFWLFLFGGLFLNSSWLLGGGADGGWFNYAPNSSVTFSPSHGIDFYALGLQITGIASLVSAINLITTVLNMRPKGMTLFRMPVFTWMNLVVQFLLLFAVPVISIALFELTFDRLFGANFFNTEAGADPLLWQHLFWIFGHPEVYILILPSFGIISEVIPTFSRKPIFGYSFMVFSGIAIGFMGWGVWAHHMFVSGIGPISVAAFSLSTMFIAVPTGVKILNWLATIWGGRLRFTTAMLFAVGVVSMFTIGGLSGVTHSVAPADTQQTDTYYIVAHFHYVIFGGALLGIFAGFYFWWPKIFGYMLNERFGKWNFWLLIVGFNLTFGPMHILGLQGMSRRIDSYDKSFGFELWNMVASIGSFIIAAGVAIFFFNIAYSRKQWKSAGMPNPGPDPWDARSLEWMTASPTPEHNFDEEITVEGLDEFWHRKYGYDENKNVVQIATAEEVAQDGSATDVHLPSPSYFPIILALGLPVIAYGLIYSLWLCIPGAALLVYGMVGWIFEHPDDPNAAHDDHSDNGGGDASPEIEGAAQEALEVGDDDADVISAGAATETESTNG
jgi:cytochrome c oxidase subunit 1